MSGIIINPYAYAETGLDPAAFVTEWTIQALGDAAARTIILPAVDTGSLGTLNYDVDWGDGSSDSGVTTVDKTHEFPSDASIKTYQVVITGQFHCLNMDRSDSLGYTSNQDRLTNMVQWGTDTQWSSLYRMFKNCTLMEYTATDFPDISNLAEKTDAREIFYNCESIVNLDLSNWTNTSNLTYLSNAFGVMDSLRTLNLTGWDTSNITRITHLCVGSGDVVNGCDFIMPNLDFSSVDSASYAFHSTKIKSMNISGWTWKAAGVSLSSFLRNSKEGTSSGAYTINAANWLPASGGSITNMASFLRGTDATSIDLTGIDTSNVTSFNYGFYYNLKLTHITGLSGFNASSVLDASSMLRACTVMDLGAGATTNFGSDWGTNLGSATTILGICRDLGSTTPGSAPPNVTDWDVSGVTSTGLCEIFNNTKWTGGGNPDTSNWEIPSTITNFYNVIRSSSVTEFDLSNAANDFSNVASMGGFAQSTTGLTRLIFNATLAKPGFTSITDMSNAFYGVTLVTGDYDELLLKLDNGGQSSVVLKGGGSKYTPTNVDSGTTDGVAANKLIQSGQNFVTTVSINDIVYNISDETYAKVTAVDDNETLSLDLDIMVSGEGYEIQSSAAAKARYSLDITKTWTISDAGPV